IRGVLAQRRLPLRPDRAADGRHRQPVRPRLRRAPQPVGQRRLRLSRRTGAHPRARPHRLGEAGPGLLIRERGDAGTMAGVAFPGRLDERLTPAGPRWGKLERVTATSGGAMSDIPEIHPVPEDFAASAGIRHDDYERLYAESIRDPDAFWAKAAERLDWDRKPTKIRDVSYDLADFHIRWYADGELNASVNCLDRHLATRGDKTALIFEPDDPDAPAEHVTYRDLHARVCRLGNALRNLGVAKGDRVTIYLPMIVDAAVAMLACARIGAIHSVVF